MKYHFLLGNRTPALHNVSVLVHEDQKFRLEIKEKLSIEQDKPHLNKSISPTRYLKFK